MFQYVVFCGRGGIPDGSPVSVVIALTRFCCSVCDFAYAVIASEHGGGKARRGIKGSTCVHVRTLFKRFTNLPWLLSMKEVQRC